MPKPRPGSRSPKNAPQTPTPPAVPTALPHLGLVCITADEHYRFRSTTLARLSTLTSAGREKLLTEIYWQNTQKLDALLGFCSRNAIRLYRISSAIYPMSDLPEGEAALNTMKTAMSAIGRRADRLQIRMVIHPDQFVVLNSPSEKVRATSRMILEKHGRNLDLLGLPRSELTAMNIHGGYAGIGVPALPETKPAPKTKRTREQIAADKASRLAALEAARAIRKRELIDLLCREIETLPPEVKSRLTLENDEHGYSSAEILEVCRRTGTPFVFDNLHHAVHEGLENYNDPAFASAVRSARTTWKNPAWQMVHLSNGAASPLDRYHAAYITQIPDAYRTLNWIEVEARGKELAIAHLQKTWSLPEPARRAHLPPAPPTNPACSD